MADNTIINPGSGGDTIATDDISSVKYPRVKIVLGADGVNDGDVASGNRFPCAYLAATTDTIAAKLATDAIMNGTTALTPKFKVISCASSGNNTIIAAVASKKLRVLSFVLNGAATVNWKFQDGAGGTDLTGLMPIVGGVLGVYSIPFCPVGWFETTANTLLNLNLSGAVQVSGWLTYVEV